MRRMLAPTAAFLTTLAGLLAMGTVRAQMPSPPPTPTTPPFTDLIASYPWGPQTVIEATPDHRRAFVAAGAAIRVLDIEALSAGVPPTPLERIEIPYCAPEAMVYHQPSSGQHHLYIAGGTLGLWRVELCNTLFQQPTPPPPVTCGSAYYTYPSATRPVQLWVADDGVQRKRCLDLCIVENNALAGAPLLFALFAARRDAPIGATELRAFRLDPNGSWAPWPGQTLNFVTFSSANPTTGWPEPQSAGTALAADPADGDFVYVALGKGGLARVELAGPNFFAVSKIQRPTCLFAPSCPDGESVRDIAIVHTATRGSFMYAASEYRGLLEYKIPPGATPAPTHPDHPSNWNASVFPLPDPYAERVSAVTNGVDYIFIAAATQTGSAIYNDTPAPFRNIGHWDGHCLAYGLPDPNSSAAAVPGSDRLIWLDRDATAAAFNPITSGL